MWLPTLSYLLFLCYGLSESAKILYVFPFTAPSHYISQKDLALQLAQRGHDVYALTSHEEKKHPPTYHQILTGIEHKTVLDKMNLDGESVEKLTMFDWKDMSLFTMQQLLYKSGHFMIDAVFHSSAVQKFLKEDHKFDLVINELFFQESLYMFAHKYQAPLVLVTSFGNSVKGNFYGRNPLQLATVYHEYGLSSDPTGFIGRLWNVIFFASEMFWIKYSYLPRQEEYARKYFEGLPEPVPSLEELSTNVSLVLMNSHFSIDTPAAYLPNFIEVGGLNHVKASKPLPKDLLELLDNAKHGVILFSLGSNVQISEMIEERLNAFLKVFGKLKETVLMKWEIEPRSDFPKNVHVRKWFPQKDILAHPNLKLFIGHGGYLGLQETIRAGVPILGMPVFADQYLNILQTKERGFGELLDYNEITEDGLRTVMDRMLEDKRYMKNAKEVSARFMDRPMSGLDTAVWWIEYVIRHKGAHFMKSPALKLNYFAYQMIDVYLFLIVILLVFMFLGFKCFSIMKRKMMTKSRVIKRKQKKN